MKITIPLDSEPDIAATLGRLVGHWALVESGVCRILGLLLQTNQPRADLVFDNFMSFASKLDLVERLAYTFLHDGPERAKLLALLSDARELNGERNAFVHAIWEADDRGSLTRWRSSLPRNTKKPRHDSETFGAAQVQEVVDRMATLSHSLALLAIDDGRALLAATSESPLV